MSDQNIVGQDGENRDLVVSIAGLDVRVDSMDGISDKDPIMGKTRIKVQRSKEHAGCWVKIEIDRRPRLQIWEIGLTHEQMNHLIQALEWCR